MAALVCIAPAHADAQAVSIKPAVDALNDAGIAHFASGETVLRRGPDLIVSPIMDWYVERFCDPVALDAQAATSDAQAEEITSKLRSAGLSFTSRASAADGQSAYTREIASDERRVLSVNTSWNTNDVSREYALIFDAKMHLDATFPPLNQIVNGAVKSYSHDGVRAVQIEDQRTAHSLFLLYGDVGPITDFRTRLTGESWNALVRKFSSGPVTFDDFRLAQSFSGFVRISRGAMFGLRIHHYLNLPNTMQVDYELSADIHGFHAEIESAVLGASRPDRNGPLRTIGGTTVTPSRDPPNTIHVSSTAPVVYILQDDATGAILLMGEHVAQN